MNREGWEGKLPEMPKLPKDRRKWKTILPLTAGTGGRGKLPEMPKLPKIAEIGKPFVSDPFASEPIASRDRFGLMNADQKKTCGAEGAMPQEHGLSGRQIARNAKIAKDRRKWKNHFASDPFASGPWPAGIGLG